MGFVINTHGTEIGHSRYIVVNIVYYISRICAYGTAWLTLLGEACCADFDSDKVLILCYIHTWQSISV